MELAKPPSTEDALSERLKSLRNQPATNSSHTDDPELQRAGRASSSPPTAQPPDTASTYIGEPHRIGKAATSMITSAALGSDNIDPLSDADDQTLEELLADLGSDEQWLEEVAAEVSLAKDVEHQKVTALLQELGKAPPMDSNSEITTRNFQRGNVDEGESADDDSDGEHMIRDADNVLAQAMDDAEWEKANQPQPKPDLAALPPSSDEKSAASKYSNSGPLKMPAVPLDLQDQPDLPNPSEPDEDFEAQIAARMAALKGPGSSELSLPSAPKSQVDELGLPVAPTFAPGDRPVKGLYKRQGYTDEDAKTWCIVCLEDGAVRCFGCDNDVYCARCWKEMHVGPSAGYDERGHRWETFVRET